MEFSAWKHLAMCLSVGLWSCGEGRAPSTLTCGFGTVQEGEACVVNLSALFSCPPGTAQVGAECKPLLTCGLGTVQQGGACVAQGSPSGTTCGAGTTLSGTECRPDLVTVCGGGTTPMGSACVAAVTCGVGTTRVGDTCTANPANLSCGAGTTLSGSQCVGALSCGAGTTQSGNRCVSTLSCGTGTALVSNACVVNLSSVCSTDTTGAGGNRCVSSLSCGSGTTRSGNQCTASGGSSVTCGPGTVLQGASCMVPSSTGPLSTFLGLATNAKAAFHPPLGANYSRDWRFVVTTLSQGNADAWANIEAPMIGSGRALHMSLSSGTDLSSTPLFKFVADSTVAGPGGSRVCPSVGLYLSRSPTSGIAVNVVDWAGGNFAPVACGRQGTVKLERASDASGVLRTRATLNVVFSDGTTLTDHVIWF